MSSTGVRACSWTLRITHAFRVVVAGRQVSLELRDSSGEWCYLLSPYRVLILSMSSLACSFLHYKAGQFSF